MSADVPSVLLVYNQPREDLPPARRESEAGVLAEVAAISEALDRCGVPHRTVGVRRIEELQALVAASPEPIVFNLVESLGGAVEGLDGAAADVNLVPAICETAGKACTGSDTNCLTLALDKARSKAILLAAGLPCPAGTVVPVGEALRPEALPPGPCIVKPAASDASEGIDARSVAAGPGEELAAAVRRVHEELGQAAIVEEFVDGPELNVSLLQQRGRVRVLAIAEIDFGAFAEGRPRIVDYAAKWLPESFEFRNTPRIIPARITAAQARNVRRVALGAWGALGCRDYARVDIRLRRSGEPVVLEVNPNPDVAPDAGFAAALAAAGMATEQFVAVLIDNARRPRRRVGESRARAGAAPRLEIRRSVPEDGEAIEDFLVRTGRFNLPEIGVAREVLADALRGGPEGHYQSYVADEAGRPVGWVCFGPTPCTVGTFDVYWLVVAPERQGRGVGRALLDRAEQLIRERGGRLAVVETSGIAVYEATRRFYRKAGYRPAARVSDFYAPGNDKIVYTKAL